MCEDIFQKIMKIVFKRKKNKKKKKGKKRKKEEEESKEVAVVCVMQFCDPHIFLVAMKAKFMYKNLNQVKKGTI